MTAPVLSRSSRNPGLRGHRAGTAAAPVVPGEVRRLGPSCRGSPACVARHPETSRLGQDRPARREGTGRARAGQHLGLVDWLGELQMWPHGAGHRQRGAGLAGGLGSSVIPASHSLRRIFLSVHRPAQDPDLSPSGPAGGPILGNLPSGRGRSTSPHQPGEKCATAGEGHALWPGKHSNLQAKGFWVLGGQACLGWACR